MIGWDRSAPHTYFLECNGHGLIKIGCSAMGVHLRIKAIQHGSPFSLVCIGMIAGDETTEAKLHKKFRPHRFRGEWFHDCPEIRAFLDEQCPAFDYAATEYKAFRFDLLVPVKKAIGYNKAGRAAMEAICAEAGIRYYSIYSWLALTSYPTEKVIWCAEQLLARAEDIESLHALEIDA